MALTSIPLVVPPRRDWRPKRIAADGAAATEPDLEGLLVVPPERIAHTKYWESDDVVRIVGRHPMLILPLSRICTLHGTGACSWGRDCRNVHLCREFIAKHRIVVRDLPILPAQSRLHRYLRKTEEDRSLA